MTDIIDFLFWILRNVWTLIVSSWILSFGVIVSIIGLIVNLYASSREE